MESFLIARAVQVVTWIELFWENNISISIQRSMRFTDLVHSIPKEFSVEIKKLTKFQCRIENSIFHSISGCLTTVLQTFLGVQTGKIIKVHKSWKSRIVRWLIFAIICAAISVGLDSTDIIPVNKNLW